MPNRTAAELQRAAARHEFARLPALLERYMNELESRRRAGQLTVRDLTDALDLIERARLAACTARAHYAADLSAISRSRAYVEPAPTPAMNLVVRG